MERRECGSCGRREDHLVWINRKTVDRKCMGCGKMQQNERKRAVQERALVRRDRERSAPSASPAQKRWAQQEREARNALDRTARSLSRKPKASEWAF